VNQRGRNTDMYGRDQSYLNRLEGLSSGGQNAAAQLGANAMNSGNAQGGYAMAGGAADAAQYQGYNTALQGTIGNYLSWDAMKNNPYGGYNPNGAGPNYVQPNAMNTPWGGR
jgi:hypothetical protein